MDPGKRPMALRVSCWRTLDRLLRPVRPPARRRGQFSRHVSGVVAGHVLQFLEFAQLVWAMFSQQARQQQVVDCDRAQVRRDARIQQAISPGAFVAQDSREGKKLRDTALASGSG